MNAIAANVVQLFNSHFMAQPAVYFSPGRINLIGEHVDYNDGFVMPAAINKGIYYAVAVNGTSDIHIHAADKGEDLAENIQDIRKGEGWANYVLGVVQEFLLLGKKISGFDCVFGGDIPIGSGMSSSAAVEGGMAYALNDLFDCGLERTELALLCQRAEHGFPGVNCGIMDQFANMMGKRGEVILLDCRDLSYRYFPLALNGHTLVLINSKVHHELAAGEYNIRRRQCEEGLTIMKGHGINSFRDLKTADEMMAYRPLMSELVFKRCLFVVEEIIRTQKAARFLQENNMAELGELMFASHDGLSKWYEVSCPELDFLVEQARSDPAVIGSRLMGGGFGGCTINIVRDDAIDQFVQQASDHYQRRFGIRTETYLVETSGGTGPCMTN
ncbi:MAG: galactokinase [Chitinophagaceae bacterium]|nr:galactokinase [Chitinophagaceae bacterium]